MNNYVSRFTGNQIDNAIESVNTKENISNKVTTLSDTSTDLQYPSAKLLYDQLALKADKVGPLPSYDASRNDNVLTFITEHNLQRNTPIILNYEPVPYGIKECYIGAIWKFAYGFIFELEQLGFDIRYYGEILSDADQLTFHDIINNNYKDIFESSKNKVTSLSDASTDTQYPSAKAVVDYVNSKENLIEITWAELKSLRDNSQLIPGRFYRITDYECTTTQVNTQSAQHQFDIIVRADSTNTLNEEASAIQHAGDTYFNNKKLFAWKLWYCLDNLTNRFAWADEVNGKGVIYRMIDEFNNDVPYDFKNIQFRVPETIRLSYYNGYTFFTVFYDGTATISDQTYYVYSNYTNLKIYYTQKSPSQYSSASRVEYTGSSGGPGDFNNPSYYKVSEYIVTQIKSLDTYKFTFSYKNTDASLVGYIKNNLLKSNFIDPFTLTSYSKKILPFNIFCDEGELGGLVIEKNIISGVLNRIGDQGSGAGARGMKFLSSVIEGDNNRIVLSSDVKAEYLKLKGWKNELSRGEYKDVVINGSYNFLYGNILNSNILGSNLSIPSYSQNITIDYGCNNIQLTATTQGDSSNYLQNLHIHAGATWSFTKTITVDRGLQYETNIVAAGTTTIEV